MRKGAELKAVEGIQWLTDVFHRVVPPCPFAATQKGSIKSE